MAGHETRSSLVISLWNVEDKTTKDLMIDYYQKLINHEEISEALRQSQLTMLKHSDYRHPFYWAAFMISGD